MRQSPSSQQSSEPTSTSGFKDPDTDPEQISSKIIEMLPRLHVLVIGPGLGRDPLMQATVARVIQAARTSNLPLVLDADALQILQKNPALVSGYKGAVLTPNVVEFGRLWKALDLPDAMAEGSGHDETGRVEALARKLEGVTIIQKGSRDYISDGDSTLIVDLEGGKKRSGGQGDTLTGAVATFLGWRKAYLDGLWDHRDEELLSENELIRLAAFGGSAITKVSFRLIVSILFNLFRKSMVWIYVWRKENKTPLQIRFHGYTLPYILFHSRG
jgi:ATP-dependent NAD(P)H-hydrate dehydratase